MEHYLDHSLYYLYSFLSLKHHLSYPCFFEDKDGEEPGLYMTPESGQMGSLVLLQCERFPFHWTGYIKLIEEISAGDTNIFKKDGCYWMFTTCAPDLKNRLLIFKSDKLASGWSLVLDHTITNSRSAGRIFEHDGKLIRPVQNGVGGYGTGIIFKSITLDDAMYDEKIIHEIKPTWHPEIFGTHNFDFNDKYIVIDGKRKIDD